MTRICVHVYIEAAMEEFRRALEAMREQEEPEEEVKEEDEDEETLDERMKRLAAEVWTGNEL